MTSPVHVVELSKPIFQGGKFIRRLRLRVPTEADLREAQEFDGTVGERGLYHLARLCNVSPRALVKASDDDLEALQAAYERVA